MEWKSYVGNRLISEHESGFYVIKPVEVKSSRPIFCPICEFIMNSVYDEDTWKKFECCDACANDWVYSDKEKWKNGWRPDIEQIRSKSEKRLFNTQERL